MRPMSLLQHRLKTLIAASRPQAGHAYAAGPKIFVLVVGLLSKSPKTDGLGPVTQATPVGRHKRRRWERA